MQKPATWSIGALELRELQAIARLPVSLHVYASFVKKLETPNAVEIYPELIPVEIQSKESRLVFAASMRHQAFWRAFSSDEGFADYFGSVIPEQRWDDAAIELAVKGHLKISYEGPYFAPDELRSLIDQLPYCMAAQSPLSGES